MKPVATTSPDRTMGHRIGEASVTVLGADGRPCAGADVTVSQRRHAFGLGNIGFDVIPLANGETTCRTEEKESFAGTSLGQLGSLTDLWLDLFNTATLPFYWGRFEPHRGRPDTDRLRCAAQWFIDRGVALKGHPLLWHTLTAPWLLGLSADGVERAQRDRIRRDVGDFAGLIDTWDAVNEAVIMPIFDKEDNGITRMCRRIGRIRTVQLAFEEAHEANPSATLLLNDFDMSSGYECLIEGVLEAGVEIDAIGLQSHMHQGYWGEEKTLAILDRFARYGLPIHLTESTLVSGHLMPSEIEDLNDYRITDWPSTPEGEERQADEVVRHYTTLVSHPAVQAVTYWGISDDGAWLGAPSGFVRRDGTPKPAYDALRGLVKGDWWLTPTTMTTDGAGRVAVRGWLGDYEVAGRAGSATFTLDGSTDALVTLP